MAVPPDTVYREIADYRQHHEKILPKEFSDYRVLSGGVGAGTHLSVKVTLQGGARTANMAVSEPEPGRVLEETDPSSETVTRFTVTPEGDGSLVRIDTRFRRSDGLRGFFESLFAPPILCRLFAAELQKLESYSGGIGG